jgi:hypothetical protein
MLGEKEKDVNEGGKAQSLLLELREIDEQFRSQLYSIHEPMKNMYLETGCCHEMDGVCTRRLYGVDCSFKKKILIFHYLINPRKRKVYLSFKPRLTLLVFRGLPGQRILFKGSQGKLELGTKGQRRKSQSKYEALF